MALLVKHIAREEMNNTLLVEGLNSIGFARTTGWLSVLNTFYKSRDAAPTTPLLSDFMTFKKHGISFE